jgi:hypothetical protein
MLKNSQCFVPEFPPCSRGYFSIQLGTYPVVTNISSLARLEISRPRLVVLRTRKTSLRLPLHEKIRSSADFFCLVDPSGFSAYRSGWFSIYSKHSFS